MKKVLFILLLCFFMIGAKAQLANTKWAMNIKINDNDVPTIFAFCKDTLVVTVEGDGSLIEKMTYTVKDGAFTIKKTEGQSDCDESAAGTYKFEIKDGAMVLTMVSDDCIGRIDVLDKAKLVKK